MKNALVIVGVTLIFSHMINQALGQGTSVNVTGEPADSSAMLDVSATDKGMLIPRMTSGERDQVSNPANGLLIYNIEENRLENYNSNTTSWQYYSNTDISIPGFICGERFIDTRDGQSYATVQIGDQCWMAENLNTGVRIDGTNEMTDNGLIEKYCYSNSNCETYGGLYQWDEMMQYTNVEGTQGVCPDGWILPSNDDWCVLEDLIVEEYILNCPEDLGNHSGTDAGTKLKGLSGWYIDLAGNDLYGFNVLPGGLRQFDGSWLNLTQQGNFWTSTNGSDTTSTSVTFSYSITFLITFLKTKTEGLSVRCLKTE